MIVRVVLFAFDQAKDTQPCLRSTRRLQHCLLSQFVTLGTGQWDPERRNSAVRRVTVEESDTQRAVVIGRPSGHTAREKCWSKNYKPRPGSVRN
jgi:hypothetical protein